MMKKTPDNKPASTAKSAQIPPNIRLPRKGYTPSKREMEHETDMPGLTVEEARAAFARKVRFTRDGGMTVFRQM